MGSLPHPQMCFYQIQPKGEREAYFHSSGCLDTKERVGNSTTGSCSLSSRLRLKLAAPSLGGHGAQLQGRRLHIDGAQTLWGPHDPSISFKSQKEKKEFLGDRKSIGICVGSHHFPGSSDSKVSAYSEGDLGSIPELGRSLGEGNGNPLQYSCLENPMDGGAW